MTGRLFNWVLVLVSLAGGPSFAQTNAVDRGLGWLAAQQHADSAWSKNPALNSLALLAFLSAGHVPASKTYGSVVDRGLGFVLTQQAEDGAFTANGAMMYGQGIATLLLAEVSGMSRRDKQVRPALKKAVDLILRAQAVEKGPIHEGGWRYDPTSTDSDLSVTVWQVIALKAASDTGIAVPRAAMERAAAYIKRCQHPSGGFSYQPGGLPNQSRTASSILALRFCGLPDDPAIQRAREWLAANPLHWESEFFYHGAYYCAHAGTGLDEQILLDHQNADGSWPAPPSTPDEAEAGPLYTTSMALLALRAKWNYLPVYFR
jgi:Squalene-hopene cyclase N-terminal domain/Prenyltransferase and squalene oxidase repeat